MTGVVAVTMVKNEADVIAWTLGHLIAHGVDRIIVADNGSTDDTPLILARAARVWPVTVLADEDPAYRQSEKMTALAELAARDFNAKWIIPFDADELWCSTDGAPLADVLADVPKGIDEVVVPLYDHFSTALDDSDQPVPFLRMGWRKRWYAALHKVAIRWQPGGTIHQGNHGVTLPEFSGLTTTEPIEIRHFPYRSAEQMIAKALQGAAAYVAAPDLPEDMGRHWRDYAALIKRFGPQEFREQVWGRYFHLFSPKDEDMVYDPAPLLVTAGDIDRD